MRVERLSSNCLMPVMKHLLLFYAIAGLNCSAHMLIPVRDGHYEEIRIHDYIYVYMKDGNRRFLTHCSFQDNEVRGTEYINYPVMKKKAAILVDSVLFITVIRKDFNTIVPIGLGIIDSLNKYDRIYIVLKNGKLLDIRNPAINGNLLQEAPGTDGKGQRYAGFPIDSIRTFAVEGVLDPWGNAVSNMEMDKLSSGRNMQICAVHYGMLTGLAAIIPAAGVSAILYGEATIGNPISFLFWSVLTYSGFKEGLRDGTKLDRNIALEKILRERAKAREDSCPQWE